MVTLDLINDLILRLDGLLDTLHRSSREFVAQVRADSAQRSRPENDIVLVQVNPMDPQLQQLLKHNMMSAAGPRPIQSILLDLHVLHAQLGKLIGELERVHGLDGSERTRRE